MHRRHTDRSSIERPHRRQARLDRLEARNTELSRSVSSNSRVAVDHTGKLNRLARLLQLAIDAKMIAAKRSSPRNRHA